MTKPRTITNKPTHLGITFSCNDRPSYFLQLRDKFDSNGLHTRFQRQSPSKGPSILLSEIFPNPTQGSVERLDVVGTQVKQVEEPADPSDWKDIIQVTKYTKQFLQAHDLLVKNPNEEAVRDV